MLRHGQTLLVVSIVSVVIWLFAEGENVRRSQLPATLQIASGTDGRLVTWVEGNTPWDGRITINASGTTAGLDQLRDRLRQPTIFSPGTEGFPSTPGDHTLDLRALLRTLRDVRETGVAIESTEPASLLVHVDLLESVELPVRVEVPDAEIDGVPEATPARVSLTLPSLVRQRLLPETTLVARIGPDVLRGLSRGRRETIQSVALELPTELAATPRGVRLTPPAVRVALTLRERTATEVLPTVPVQIRVAPIQLARWQIIIPEADQFLQDVRVTGPSDEIERIRRGELRVIAVVSLSAQELASRITSKQVSFSDFPTTLQFQVEDPIITLEIREIPGATISNPPGGPSPQPEVPPEAPPDSDTDSGPDTPPS
ncbi:YbbR-like domain-containing protein [Nodularia spumigena]|uniref:hypothetical protein n=1 Tax=Nodularia spumigena TaxID=70799 RepID=UPI002B1FF91E|nr:hypothetical protein [Nodularia spumigena]MEA5557685.1 hypothetical protein [Nodularia spumigena CH309]